MPYLDRDGVRVRYDAVGTGPAILFTHGFAASSAMFGPQVRALAAGYTIVTWDLRGHGDSAYPADPAAYSVPLVIADMVALLDSLGIERAVLVGHSVGGYLSLRFHVCHPERVRALVLVGTAPGFRRDDRREEWNRSCLERARRLEELGLEAVRDSEEVRAARHRDASGLAHAARGILTQEDAQVIDSLPAVRVPTLILAGRKDVVDGYDYAALTDYMAAKIRGAQRTIFEHSAHAPCLTEPEAFNERLRAFLREVDAAGA